MRRTNSRSKSKKKRFEHGFRTRIADLTLLWQCPAPMQPITVRFSPRLLSSLGRANCLNGRISLAPYLKRRPALLEHVFCHELAHLVAFRLVGRSEPAHGPTWRRLMRLAGYAPSSRLAFCSNRASQPAITSFRYRHRCPICDFSRIARRPMPAWRCADCVAAGLDGRLQIDALGSNR